MTMRQFLELLGFSFHYYRSCRAKISILECYLGRPAHLADFDNDLLAGFMEHRLRVAKKRIPTVNSDIRALKVLWRRAHEAMPSVVTTLPDNRVADLRDFRVIPTTWSDEELERILAACGQERGFIGRIKAADFWTVWTLLNCDLDISKTAALNLSTGAVDLDKRTLTVPGKYRKGGRDLIAPLSARTVEALTKILHPYTLPRGYVLDWEHDRFPSSFWPAFTRRWRTIVERAGLSLRQKRFVFERRDYVPEGAASLEAV